MDTAPKGRVPAITLGWRLKMALSEGGLTREQMAELLGVAPATCSRWMHDQGAPPKQAFINEWATLTGVSRYWLETGFLDPSPRVTVTREVDALAA